jgi:hypothetical protein
MPAAFLLMNAVLAAEPQLPSGRLEFTGKAGGLLVGYQQGTGSLDFADARHPFRIEGYSLGMAGLVDMEGWGVVYNLKELDEFQGRYEAVGGGMTTLQGGNLTLLRNERDVVIELQTFQQGLEARLGITVYYISLTEPLPAPAEKPAAPAAAPSPLELISQPDAE